MAEACRLKQRPTVPVGRNTERLECGIEPAVVLSSVNCRCILPCTLGGGSLRLVFISWEHRVDRRVPSQAFKGR